MTRGGKEGSRLGHQRRSQLRVAQATAKKATMTMEEGVIKGSSGDGEGCCGRGRHQRGELVCSMLPWVVARGLGSGERNVRGERLNKNTHTFIGGAHLGYMLEMGFFGSLLKEEREKDTLQIVVDHYINF